MFAALWKKQAAGYYYLRFSFSLLSKLHKIWTHPPSHLLSRRLPVLFHVWLGHCQLSDHRKFNQQSVCWQYSNILYIYNIYIYIIYIIYCIYSNILNIPGAELLQSSEGGHEGVGVSPSHRDPVQFPSQHVGRPIEAAWNNKK